MIHGYNDSNKAKVEMLSKEQVYAVLAEAIQTGQLPLVPQDTAFVTMIKSIIDGVAYKIAFCTQATYNELKANGELVANAVYIITDDGTYDDLVEAIGNLDNEMEDLDTAQQAMQTDIDDLGHAVSDLQGSRLYQMIPTFVSSYVMFNIDRNATIAITNGPTLGSSNNKYENLIYAKGTVKHTINSVEVTSEVTFILEATSASLAKSTPQYIVLANRGFVKLEAIYTSDYFTVKETMIDLSDFSNITSGDGSYTNFQFKLDSFKAVGKWRLS